jgi:hypothetical protein
MGICNVFFDPDQPAGSKFPSSTVRQEIAAIVPIDLEPGSVTGDKLANQAVGTNQIANGAITAQQIASQGVTAANIADGTITSEQIAPNTIDAANCGAGVMAVTDINGNNVQLTAVVCSSAQYAALNPPNPNVIYYITS